MPAIVEQIPASMNPTKDMHNQYTLELERRLEFQTYHMARLVNTMNVLRNLFGQMTVYHGDNMEESHTDDGEDNGD